MDIKCLTSVIIEQVLDGDNSLETHISGLAQWLLFTKKISLHECIQYTKLPKFKQYLLQLINTSSDFMRDGTPRNIGVLLMSTLNAGNMQQKLNVKHFEQIKQVAFKNSIRIMPDIKTDILHTHPQYIWIRFYYSKNINELALDINNIAIIDNNVYEYYYKKPTKLQLIKNKSKVFKIIEYIDKVKGVVIFCSELVYFQYNVHIFLSNYLKFHYCYKLNASIFDPVTYEETFIMSLYLTCGLLFLDTKNLSIMKESTHGPLCVFTGERPKTSISKMDEKKIYNNDGSRASMALGGMSDLGTRSNYSEIILKIELDTKVLDKLFHKNYYNI